MATLLHNITRFYHYLNVELADPRTNDFPFLSSPWPIIALLFCYHRFVRVWGPEFMKNRAPYDLKKFIIVYNAIQICASSYCVIQVLAEIVLPYNSDGMKFYQGLQFISLYGAISLFVLNTNACLQQHFHSLLLTSRENNLYSFFSLMCKILTCLRLVYIPGIYNIVCQKIITDDTPFERLVVRHVWLYYIIKIVDLLDTVIFILRKKFTQASFLHVYHHMGMCLLAFIGAKYIPGGHGVMLGFLNSGVHAIMYTYYLISAVRPQWIRRWWKKYITQLQILQFLLLFIHFGHVLLDPECEYPKWISLAILPQITFMLILFTDFYLKEYVFKTKNKSQ